MTRADHNVRRQAPVRGRLSLPTTSSTLPVIGAYGAAFAMLLILFHTVFPHATLQPFLWVAAGGLGFCVWFTLEEKSASAPVQVRKSGVKTQEPTRVLGFEEQHRLHANGVATFDRVPFAACNVDHLLIGPSGIFAVQTEYIQTSVKASPTQIEAAIDRAQEGAAKTTLLLQAAQLELPVTPVLVFWGPGAPALPNGRVDADGVTVVDGRGSGWTNRLTANALAHGDIAQASRVIRDFIELCERHRRSNNAVS